MLKCCIALLSFKNCLCLHVKPIYLIKEYYFHNYMYEALWQVQQIFFLILRFSISGFNIMLKDRICIQCKKNMVISCQEICPTAIHLNTSNFPIVLLHPLSHLSSLEHEFMVRGRKNMTLSDRNVGVKTAGKAWPTWVPLLLPYISINALQVKQGAWNELKQTDQENGYPAEELCFPNCIASNKILVLTYDHYHKTARLPNY